MSDYCFECRDFAYVPDGAIVPYVYWVEPSAMASLINDVVLLDVRTVEEAQAEPLPGGNVLNIPLSQLGRRITEVPANLPVVIVCETALRAKQANELLRHHGYDNIWVLTGGMANWRHWLQSSTGRYWSEGMSGTMMRGTLGSTSCMLPTLPATGLGIAAWALAKTYAAPMKRAGRPETVEIYGQERTPGNVGWGVFAIAFAWNVIARSTCKTTA
jgi:rhodanese-related sulfurtransferase